MVRHLPLSALRTFEAAARTAAALLDHALIESAVKKVRWPAWFAANGMIAPEPRGPRFDRSFLSLRAAMDGLGVALESTRLAERELAEGSLVRPLEGICQDVVYTAHWLVFPRARRYARSVVIFAEWMALQLGLMMVINLGIGLYTPPAGTTLFISSTIAGAGMGETVRALWPFFFVALGVLLAISYVPALTLTF